MRRLPLVLTVVTILLAASAYVIWGRLFTRKIDIPTTIVRKGDLLISLTVNGEIDAKRAQTIVAPRVRNIQITWMAPEGSMVEAGDPVIRFDATQQMADLTDNESSLRISQTSLDRAKQELAIQEKQLTLNLSVAQRNYDEKKHEAPKVAEEARLELDLAELNARAKLDQIRSDVQKAELEVQRARDRVAMAKRELEQMTLTAPIPGMVVYLDIWKGSSASKVQPGDSPWPGQGLINLPDLSEMMVRSTASEVDAGRIDAGMPARIRLDALPDTTFSGTVDEKGTLAHPKEPGSKINVFDVEVGIDDKDERLKPGMSASAKIIISKIENVVSVPLEAVFEVEGKSVVYLPNKKRRDVKVGRRTDMEIEITEGLEPGERICLVDPTRGEGRLPGDRATEPEINRSIQQQPPTSPPRGRRGR